MPPRFTHFAVTFLTAAAVAPVLHAQERLPINPTHAYFVRFTCGTATEGFQEGVVRGVHATSISLHNPSRQRAVNFTKRIARALPFQRSDDGSATVVDTLPPRAAIDIECNEIRMFLPSSMTAQFRSGVLEIHATGALDVVVVYSARPRDGDVSTIDIETVAADVLRPATTNLPDLVVSDIDMENLRVDCPQGAGSCRARVTVTVTNKGSAPSGPSTLLTTFDPRQRVDVTNPVPGVLAPGASIDVDVSATTGGNCYDPDCRICATADTGDDVEESDEGNNSLCQERQG